jgi:5-methylcytosine-specific restriction enzyme B
MSALSEVEQAVDDLSISHRVWVIPILATVQSLGGKAAPKDVELKIRELYGRQLSDLQLAYAIKGKHIRWARNAMRSIQLIAGEYGTWVITEVGATYLAAHANDLLDFSSIPELDAKEAGDLSAPLETVQTTAREAYEVPLLAVLSSGASETQELLAAVDRRLRQDLLPGDFRVNRDGGLVSPNRVNWALTTLREKGHVRSVRRGLWEITEAGREYLAQEQTTWDIKRYQDSRSKVRAMAIRQANPVPASAPPQELLDRWQKAKQSMGNAPFQIIEHRLRPDLDPTPTTSIARNVILYGPPGTGKTFVAKGIARALTGDDKPGPESRWRLVQFHPSYAYEDFVQGLRPDLEQSNIRYRLTKGPLLQICAQAEQDPDKFYVLIIDEINRGDPARIFGELLYAIEYRGELVDLALGGQLMIPPNLVIIGTMNSVDRSVALVDYALRRRFAFARLQPAPEIISVLRTNEPAAEIAADVLDTFNQWLISQLGREHALGHSVFLNAAIKLEHVDALHVIWEMDVLPLLEEFFFGDPARITEASSRWRAAIAEAVRDHSSPPE